MSSGAGGAVVGVVLIAPVAAAAVVGIGLAWGAGKCAIGLAKGAYAVGRAANELIAEHEQTRTLLARQLELERQRWAEYEATRLAFETACATAGIDPITLVPGPCPTQSSEVAEIQETLVAMATATAQVRRELSNRAVAERANALARAVEHQATSAASAAETVLDAARAEATARIRSTSDAADAARDLAVAEARQRARAASEAKARARIVRALAELPEDVDEETERRVDYWTERLDSLTGDRLAQAATDLEAVCGQARSKAALHAAHDEAAAAVVAALAGSTAPASAEIIGRARAYLAGQLPWDPRLVDRAKAEVARIQGEFEDLWAAHVIAECLARLGYELGPEFTVDMLAGGAYASRPEWTDHGVEFSVDPNTGRFQSEVTRQGVEGQASTTVERAEDVDVASQFCADLDRLVECTGSHQVAVRITRRDKPGERELVRADVHAAMTGRRTRARHDEDALSREVRPDE